MRKPWLFLGWIGAKPVNLGQVGIKRRTLEIGFQCHVRGWIAVLVGTILLLAGLLLIAPFGWGVAYILSDVTGYKFLRLLGEADIIRRLERLGLAARDRERPFAEALTLSR